MNTPENKDKPNSSPSGRLDGSAIILAGGLGTRLRGVINDLPKAMAPVNGKPFLHYIFKYLEISEIIIYNLKWIFNTTLARMF